MDQLTKNNIDVWLSGNYDQKVKDEIHKLLDENQDEKLTDAFYKSLEFGTGGLRGIMGVGPNRMNKYTVGAATQGLSNYVNSVFSGEANSAAIAYDSRNNSAEFAQIVANVFSANGIKVYLFDELRPTPELSYAIRVLGCKTGVVLTASHNPKEYNGYKAYWNDGAQVIPPHDKNIITEVQKIQSVDEIKFEGNEGLIQRIGTDIDKQYISDMTALSLSPEIIKKEKDLKIVFSSIHGTGITLVPNLLKSFGFENVHTVEEQDTPDGNFSTVVYPNPEEEEAMKLTVKKAKELDADIALATDPDADRVGAAVKNHKGEFQLLNGNQTASILVYYILSVYKDSGRLTGKEFTVKTIVTTELIKAISDDHDVEMFDVLTGFKYIAGIIRELEGKKKFLVGGEESYGYLVSDLARDKDAVVSCAFIAEAAAYFKSQGKSMFDVLVELYTKYGFYKESLTSLKREGKKGQEEIAAMMEGFRNDPPQEIAGEKLILVKDYLSSETKDLTTGTTTKIDLPKSNVIQLITEQGSKISMRPSGTEPKIKFYVGVKEALVSTDEFTVTEQKLQDKIAGIYKSLGV